MGEVDEDSDSAEDMGSASGSKVYVGEAYTEDKFFYRRVAYMLGGVVVLCVGFGFWSYMCPLRTSGF